MLEDITTIGATPDPIVVSSTGEDLSRCAFVFASNVDRLLWTDGEAAAFGDWLRKGGFLWTDGFWTNSASENALDNWRGQLLKALPEAQIRQLHTHPIFESPFEARLQRQPCPWGGWVKHFAVEDDEGRLMVLMTFNEKYSAQCGAVGDAWEGFAQRLWHNGETSWKFSVNVLLHVMTH